MRTANPPGALLPRGEKHCCTCVDTPLCPICASADRIVVDTEASVVWCRGCGHRYVEPRPTQQEIARGYSLPTAYDDWIQVAGAREAMWRRRFDRVLGADPPGRLLDVRSRDWYVSCDRSRPGLVRRRDRGSPIIGLGAASFGQRHIRPGAPETRDYIGMLALVAVYETGMIGAIALAAGFLLLLALLVWRGNGDVGRAAAYAGSITAFLVSYQATSALWFSINWLIVGAALAFVVRSGQATRSAARDGHG